MTTDKKKLEMVKKLIGEIDYTEIKRITKGVLSRSSYMGDYKKKYVDDLIKKLSEYKSDFVFIGSDKNNNIFKDIDIDLDYAIIGYNDNETLNDNSLTYNIHREQWEWGGWGWEHYEGATDEIDKDRNDMLIQLNNLPTIKKYARGYNKDENIT